MNGSAPWSVILIKVTRRILITALLSLGLLPGREIAFLASGADLRIDRHEIRGDRVLLFNGEGFIEMAASEVVGFEKLPDPPAPPPPPPPAEPTPAAPVPKPPVNPKELVENAARKHGLPPEFVKLVARAESAYDPKALSPKGAIGVMQLMPATAQALKVDPHDVEQNVEGGVRLLRELLARYEDYPDQLRRALAAYNAGEGAVQKYNGVPPYSETRHYVHKIVEQYKRTVSQ